MSLIINNMAIRYRSPVQRQGLGKLIAISLVLSAIFLPQTAQSAGMDKFIAMGTGSTGGVFYPVGRGICKLINSGRLNHRIRCLAYETGGSVYNIEAVRSRELDVGITRSDLATLTFQGKSIPPNELGPADELRAIANLYEMPVGIIVKEKANINVLNDFKGKRLNFGNRGSGKRTVAEIIFKYKGWVPKDFNKVTEFKTRKMGEEFCANKLDILIELLGHPAEFYRKMIEECGGKLFNFSQEDITGLTEILPFSLQQNIRGGLYYDTPNDIKTFGFQAVMITSSKIHPKSIFHLMKSTFGNLKKLHKIHPALEATSRESMTERLGIPLHQGAKQFYGTAGIQKK